MTGRGWWMWWRVRAFLRLLGTWDWVALLEEKERLLATVAEDLVRERQARLEMMAERDAAVARAAGRPRWEDLADVVRREADAERRAAAAEASLSEARAEALALFQALGPGDCEPLPDVAGIVTQISNQVAGLRARAMRNVRDARELVAAFIRAGAWSRSAAKAWLARARAFLARTEA